VNVAFVHSNAGGDITLNVDEAIATLGPRVALAPPVLGEWDLVGREADLSRLHATLEAYDTAAVTPVTGTGGLGKTALAIGYLATHGEHYDLIAWIEAEKPELIGDQYRKLVLNHTGHDLPEADAIVACRTLLANLDRTLVVFDNATTSEAIQRFLPPGRTLVTTRNDAWTPNPDRLVALDPLDDDVVVAWLTRALGPSADLPAIAEHLGGLPLAVTQAIAFITARPGETPATYLHRLRHNQPDVYAAKAPPDHPVPLAKTWDIAMRALAAAHPVALELLRHLAYIAPDDIPVSLLEGLLPDTDLPALLEVLRTNGLIRATKTHITIHRLVQDITRWAIPDENHYLQHWVTHLAATEPDDDSWDPAEIARYRDIAPHVLVVAEHGPPSDDLVRVTRNTGFSLTQEGNLTAADVLLERALAMAVGLHHDNHPSIALALDCIGVLDRSRGNLPAALDHHERALAILENAYGREHLSLSTVLRHLGAVHLLLGDREAARACLARSLEISDATAPNSPHVAEAMNSLGVIYRHLRDPERALDLVRQSQAILEEHLPPDHPQLAPGLCNLGDILGDMGDYESALDAYERSLRINEAAFGPQHRNIIIALNNIGATHSQAGRPRESVDFLLRALQMIEETYGRHHPDGGMTLSNVAEGYLQLGDRRSARPYAHQALAVCEDIFGAENQVTIEARRLVHEASRRRWLGSLGRARRRRAV
jgi:tetratricopeptide (TPR) repeat protein